MVRLGQAFQPVGGLEQHAALKQAAGSDNLHRRHGKPERAGTGDDQHGDGGQQCALPVAGRPPPSGQRPGGQDMHGRGIDAGGPVGQLYVFGTALFGGLHQAHDLG